MNVRARCVWLIALIAPIIFIPQAMAPGGSSSSQRDINAVLSAHDKTLLALPDVVGVYVGTLADGRTPCLHVMLSRKNATTERKIPRELEGYRVLVEVTGEIRALGGR